MNFAVQRVITNILEKKIDISAPVFKSIVAQIKVTDLQLLVRM